MEPEEPLGFVSFNPTKKKDEAKKEVKTKPAFSTLEASNESLSPWIQRFGWLGIGIAVLGFGDIILFMVGAGFTGFSLISLKSESDFGNNVARSKNGVRRTLTIILIMLSILRVFELILIGI